MTMLDTMRRHREWLKWFLGLVVLAFVAFYARDFVDTTSGISGAPISAAEVVATVEGQDISAADFQRRYSNQIQSIQQAYGGNVTETMLRQLGIDRQILQQMVDEQAALTEAERQHLEVSDDELGQVFGHDLRAVGVHFRPGRPEADTPTGRCIIVVTPDAQRTMNTYLGVSSLLQPHDIHEETVAAGRVLYMEGYLYDRPEIGRAHV